MLCWFRALVAIAFVTTPGLAWAVQGEATLAQLSKVRLDKTQIYSVRDITLNRDVLSISLNRGAIAFTEAIEGKITGAVFIGSGDILAIPPDAIEKKQLFRYTKSALLSEHFEAAVFRFTDGTWEEIQKELKGHAPETVDAADLEALLRWESEVQRRAAFLNGRILVDLLGSKAHPFFLAQIEGAGLGWFDAIYDERNVEEVLIQQSTTASATPFVWTSFNKRSDARDPLAAARDDKSLFENFSLSADGTIAQLKLRADGERVLTLPVASAAVTSVLFEGVAIPFVAERERLYVILPTPTRSRDEITLRIEYSTEARPEAQASAAVRANTISPLTYRDQWIVEALGNYASVLTDPAVLNQARESLLAPSPEGGSYESLGPVWIGIRMTQPRTTPGYQVALKNKSLWILHMLRGIIQGNNGESAFGRFLDEVLLQAQGSRLSTFDFKRLAEKHAGKPLDWFFDSWVFGTGIPSYTVTFKVDSAPDGFVISGNITQAGVPDTFESPVPLYADETFLGNVTVSGDGGEFRFTSRTRPQQVLVDPKGTILKRIG